MPGKIRDRLSIARYAIIIAWVVFYVFYFCFGLQIFMGPIIATLMGITFRLASKFSIRKSEALLVKIESRKDGLKSDGAKKCLDSMLHDSLAWAARWSRRTKAIFLAITAGLLVLSLSGYVLNGYGKNIIDIVVRMAMTAYMISFIILFGLRKWISVGLVSFDFKVIEEHSRKCPSCEKFD